MIRTLFAIFFVTSVAFGQDSTAKKNRELYLTFANFSPLNIHLKYKHQIGQRTYFKIGLVNLSASHIEYIPNSPQNYKNSDAFYSGGAEIGIEFRKVLTERFSLFHGPNLRYDYRTDIRIVSNPFVSNQKNVTEAHTGSIPYTVGVLFNLTPKLLLAVEVNPLISFTRLKSSSTAPAPNIAHTFNFSLDNRSGLLSFALRF